MKWGRGRSFSGYCVSKKQKAHRRNDQLLLEFRFQGKNSFAELVYHHQEHPETMASLVRIGMVFLQDLVMCYRVNDLLNAGFVVGFG